MKFIKLSGGRAINPAHIAGISVVEHGHVYITDGEKKTYSKLFSVRMHIQCQSLGGPIQVGEDFTDVKIANAAAEELAASVEAAFNA